MGSGRQPASAACISLAYEVKCRVEGVLGAEQAVAEVLLVRDEQH